MKKSNDPIDEALIIGIDFDDTIAYSEEDNIPKRLLPNAKEVINWLHKQGCTIIIWTCRPLKDLPIIVNFLMKNKIHYDKINEQSDSVTFTDSPKIFCNLYVDDRSFENYREKEINWLEIKEKIRKILLERLIEKMINVKNSSVAPMLRGKPNDENPDVGMDESEQKMYDGVDRNEKRYDQLEILDEDVLDREELAKRYERIEPDETEDYIQDGLKLVDLINKKKSQKYTDDLSYFEDPKGKGQKIPEAIKGIDKERAKIQDELIVREVIKTEPYHRDETQKYLPADQKLYRDYYWKEKRDKGMGEQT